jgi:hypothetical protein
MRNIVAEPHTEHGWSLTNNFNPLEHSYRLLLTILLATYNLDQHI